MIISRMSSRYTRTFFSSLFPSWSFSFYLVIVVDTFIHFVSRSQLVRTCTDRHDPMRTTYVQRKREWQVGSTQRAGRERTSKGAQKVKAETDIKGWQWSRSFEKLVSFLYIYVSAITFFPVEYENVDIRGIMTPK